MPDRAFLELEDHIGVEPTHLHETDAEGEKKPHPNAGEPGPLTSEAFSYSVPVAYQNPSTGKTEVGYEVRSVQILPSEQPVKAGAVTDLSGVAADARIIPGTRVIETTSPHVVSILTGEGGGYRQVDPPKAQSKKTTSDQEA